jgi:hypothetical protein
MQILLVSDMQYVLVLISEKTIDVACVTVGQSTGWVYITQKIHLN